MTDEEEFIQSIYDEADEDLKEVYKEQKQNRDELLQTIAMIILTYTVLDGLMSLKSKDKRKEYKRLSKLIINGTQSQKGTQTRAINNILGNTVKNTFNFYSYNANLKDVKKIVDANFKGKHFSERVWTNEKAVGKHLHKQVKQFLDGKINVNQIKKDIEKTYNTNAYNAKRLVETEVNRCENEAFDKFCKETGVKKVRYNATLDKRLCADCEKHHDQVFDFDKKIELPRHALCRCFYTIEDEEVKKSKTIEEKTVLKSSKDGIINDEEEQNKDELVINLLSKNNIEFVKRISEKEIVVKNYNPVIKEMSKHAEDNLKNKADRANMTIEKAQSFINNAKLVIFDSKRETIKFMAQYGYTVLNFDDKLITAVPQKWRNKYNKYLEEGE